MKNQKLILFDIDGTLISGRGIPKKVAIDVIHKFFPHFTNGDEVPFSGMTDPLIVKEILRANGHTIDIDDPLIFEILDTFIQELAKQVSPEYPPLVLPGVEKILHFFEKQDDYVMGLVTGNVAAGARIKLNAAGLYPYFAVGAFGCDHWDRNRLPAIALDRAKTYFRTDFSANDCWIIGDSVRDVECARVNGMKCLAVETGKTETFLLEQAGPQIVLKDLTDLNYIIELINNN